MEKPILFNTDMVKAILDCKKTCTRRVINPQPVCYGPNLKYKHDHDKTDVFLSAEKGILQCRRCGNYPEYSGERSNKANYWKPPYRTGDILYVRETWCDTTKDLNDDSDLEVGECRYIFKVDDNGHRQPVIEIDVKRWRPSIHMPKEAARIFLEVIDVRVERLQEITEDEAIKEGIRQYTKDGEVFKYAAGEYQYKWSEMPRNPIEAFKKLWNSCYNWPKCWTYNPWVWVIEFKRVEK